MNILTLILLIIFLLIIYAIATYNSFRILQIRIKASIQEIGNQLKRQAELIPNLVESTKGYLEHEKDIFDRLTEARKAIVEAINSGSLQKMVDTQELISQAIQPLRVIVESNPQLQSAAVVTNLMNELRDTADKVMYARRTLIDLTADYNTKLMTIPTSWIGSVFKFEKEKGLKVEANESFLKVSDQEVRTPKVNFD